MPKFSVDLSRSETREMQLFADDREGAVLIARTTHPGFSVDGLVELGEGDAPVAEHTPIAGCETCAATVFEGDDYATDNEAGGYFCPRCKAEMLADAAQPTPTGDPKQ